MPPVTSANILLISDRPGRLLSYDAMLAGLGHRLVHAQSGEEGLERLTDTEFAAIVLVADTHGRDGLEIAALIRRHRRHERTPVILLCAGNEAHPRRLVAGAHGAIDLVTVPVAPEVLQGKVQLLVDVHRQRAELETLNRKLAEANTELADANASLRARSMRELDALNGSLAAAHTELEEINAALQVEIEQRMLAQSALNEADRKKDDFLAMLSHELRNPLAAMHGAIELMRRRKIEDEHIALAGAVLQRQSRHLSRLIEDLLDVSRITRGTLTLRRDLVDLREVVAHALEATRPAMEARGHDVVIALPDDPIVILGDHVRLTQAVTNLLANAAIYTSANGRIRLHLRCAGGDATQPPSAALAVEDNGCGIDAALLARLFEPLPHAERLRRGARDGLGIGLAVVRGLIDMHGGRTEAFSDGPGKGSRFIVHLPLHDERMTPTMPNVQTAPSPPAAALRILVVDDNEDSAESMSLLLQCDGHEVTTAYSGERALQLACDAPPDVVLLDIGMPGMMGYEVAQRLRNSGAAESLLIAVTGYGRESDVERARAAGFDHHLVKPVDYDKLRALFSARYGDRSSKASG